VAEGLPPRLRVHKAARGLLLTLVLVLASACAGRPAPKAAPEPVRKGWTQKGEASWYGKEYHGRNTASGERYDMYKMTAAHQTLPFHTLVRVKNLDNGREIKVRITDRGPFVKGRILDLSYGAARKLRMVETGVAPVKITVLEVGG
jgi:rare lipoprotein A